MKGRESKSGWHSVGFSLIAALQQVPRCILSGASLQSSCTNVYYWIPWQEATWKKVTDSRIEVVEDLSVCGTAGEWHCGTRSDIDPVSLLNKTWSTTSKWKILTTNHTVGSNHAKPTFLKPETCPSCAPVCAFSQILWRVCRLTASVCHRGSNCSFGPVGWAIT